MAESKRSTRAEAQQLQSLYEVLVRRPVGGQFHEQVHRFRADNEAAARKHVVEDLDVPADQVVEVNQVPG